MITSFEPGGVMARSLLPAVFIIPIVLGWVRLQGQKLGFFSLEQGLAFLVVILVILFTVVIAVNAKSLNKIGNERKKLLESESKARQEAELEREKLHSLFLQAPAIISLTRGPKHIFELYNIEARKRINGRDLTGLKIREALPELNGLGYFEALDRAYATGEPILLRENPANLKQADGTYDQYYFNVIYHPWRDFAGNVAGILNISIDVTEQVLARKKVEDALKAREDFISIASHELKTPITVLKMHFEMARRNIKPELGIFLTPEKQIKLLDVSERQVNRLTALIEDMLDVIRIQAGKLNFNLQPVNLAALVQDVVAQFADSLEATKNSIVVRVRADIVGLWDRMRLEQVLVNLVVNAVKYAPGTMIEILAEHGADSVEITIRDHGPGISKKNQETLFGRFERAGASRNISGLGLGLYISKQIIDTHGGSIRIESEEGRGASFIIKLPMRSEKKK